MIKISTFLEIVAVVALAYLLIMLTLYAYLTARPGRSKSVLVPRELFDTAMKLADEMTYATTVCGVPGDSYWTPRVNSSLKEARRMLAGLPSACVPGDCFGRWHELRQKHGFARAKHFK